MNLAYAYPKSRFEPAVLVDLNSRAERERLSQVRAEGLLQAGRRLEAARRGRARTARRPVLVAPIYEWKKNPDRVLEVDRITRISYLLGIYKALHILYGDKLADEWVALPNTNPVFAGRTPLSQMLAGGLLAMQTVRKLLDARRGGL